VDISLEVALKIQITGLGTSMVAQWLRLYISTPGESGSIPVWGTKNPPASRSSKKKKKILPDTGYVLNLSKPWFTFVQNRKNNTYLVG